MKVWCLFERHVPEVGVETFELMDIFYTKERALEVRDRQGGDIDFWYKVEEWGIKE